ncbi:hypothetical protein BC833DRAFT_584106 [Globomyces pollinis-pini]|nr:hypothetical protein BC833DRAFT_584106 [Globomyces pollinis-pini]
MTDVSKTKKSDAKSSAIPSFLEGFQQQQKEDALTTRVRSLLNLNQNTASKPNTAAITLEKSEVQLIMNEFNLDKQKAELALKQNNGELSSTILSLIKS